MFLKSCTIQIPAYLNLGKLLRLIGESCSPWPDLDLNLDPVFILFICSAIPSSSVSLYGMVSSTYRTDDDLDHVDPVVVFREMWCNRRLVGESALIVWRTLAPYNSSANTCTHAKVSCGIALSWWHEDYLCWHHYGVIPSAVLPITVLSGPVLSGTVLSVTVLSACMFVDLSVDHWSVWFALLCKSDCVFACSWLSWLL